MCTVPTAFFFIELNTSLTAKLPKKKSQKSVDASQGFAWNTGVTEVALRPASGGRLIEPTASLDA